MIFKRILVVLALAFAGLAPAAAQFADQATWAGTGAGSANAQTITVANASSYSDLLGVLIKFVPGATNGSGGMTLGVTGLAGGAPSVRRPTTTGPSTAMIGNEFVTGQPVVVMYNSAGFFDLISVPNTTTSVGSSNLLNSSLQFGVPVNLQLNATVSSNNLTIAIKGNNGSDPSATNPVLIPFRNSTIANGDPNIVSLQGALSFTINSSNTMGCVSGQMCRLWVITICSTGLECTGSAGSDVVALCAFNALSGTSVAPINEAALQTSASGTSGGSSSQTYYCNASAVTAKAIRIIGYIEIQEATAGTWATGPTYTQLFGPGIKKPGDIVQEVNFSTTSSVTITGTTTPTQTNIKGSITPTSAANMIEVDVWTSTECLSSAAACLLELARSNATTSPSNVFGSPSYQFFNSSANTGGPNNVTGNDLPNTTNSTTYSLYGFETASSGSPVFIVPQTNAASQTSGQIRIKEIMSANDNGTAAVDGRVTTMAATPVTPGPGLASQVAVGGTAVVVAAAAPNGGYIQNPVSANDQGLANTENLYVSPVAAPGSVDGDGNGTTFVLPPGGIWNLIPGQTTVTWANAASSGHRFSIVVF